VAQPRKCIIIGPAFPLRGGIAQLNESLSEQLTAMGIQNVIYSFSLQYPSIFFPGETQHEASDRKPPAGIHIKATINSVNPFTWWDTARKIAAEKPDMIVVRFWLPFMAPALGSILKQLRKRLKVPVVGLLDNVVPHEKRMGDKRLTRFFLDQCDAFVVMSSTVMKELSQFDTQKPRVLLYHPIYDHFGEKVDKLAARKHLSLASDAKVILFFGIIRKYKGLKLLLEAISKMPDKHRLKLVVAGEFYEDRAIYTRLIEKLKLQGNVLVNAGFVDKYKVKFYFCAADIVAQPYLSATQSGVTQIAYHFEAPMLVTNVGGLPEMVAHNKVGYVCAPDRDDIARSLSAYFNEDRYEEFCSNIREEKKRFSWEHFANGIVSLAMSV
jgi:glycosyltransferase involved in cell wall biosynthesis